MVTSGQRTPILVRRDGDRLVLVEGLHRLEACKALGEETIVGLLVQARRHEAHSEQRTNGIRENLESGRNKQSAPILKPSAITISRPEHYFSALDTENGRAPG